MEEFTTTTFTKTINTEINHFVERNGNGPARIQLDSKYEGILINSPEYEHYIDDEGKPKHTYRGVKVEFIDEPTEPIKILHY